MSVETNNRQLRIAHQNSSLSRAVQHQRRKQVKIQAKKQIKPQSINITVEQQA